MTLFSHVRAVIRLILVFAWLLLWLVPMAVLSILRLPWFLAWMAQSCSRGLLLISNIKISASGVPLATSNKNKGVLLVGNHISYLDILTLNVLFSCRFISKSDVADWPIFGSIAKAQKTIFVRRSSRSSLMKTQEEINNKLFGNHPYVLFAEATSSDGSHILPFRSNLLQVAVANKDIYLQSFCVQYRLCNGLPIGRSKRPLFAWYGDMELLPHLWELLHIDSAHIEVRLAEPVKGDDYAERKGLTKKLQSNTENMLEYIRQDHEE